MNKLAGKLPFDNMKGIFNLLVLHAFLSTISGILLSKMSLVGKVGIFMFYKEYAILKVWWKAALLLFVFQLVCIALFGLARWLFGKSSIVILSLFLIAGIAGIYLTYVEFTNTSYRLMRSQFHAGGYLIWAGYIISCLYFMFKPYPKRLTTVIENQTHPPSALPNDPNHQPLEG